MNNYIFESDYCRRQLIVADDFESAWIEAQDNENGAAGWQGECGTAVKYINCPFDKIVTHAGAFHADELIAIAIIKKVFGSLPVERVLEVTPEMVSDARTCVLDIGLSLDPDRSNFDHHHLPDSPATNILVALEFVDQKIYEKLKLIFEYASDVDRGIRKITPEIPCLNSIVRSFNSTGQFEVALMVVQKIVDAMWTDAKRQLQVEKEWGRLERIVIGSNTFAINRTEHVLPGWNALAKTAGCRGLISPNDRGGWQIISSDSDEWTVPITGNQTFRHNSGFMAVYPSLDILIESLA